MHQISFVALVLLRALRKGLFASFFILISTGSASAQVFEDFGFHTTSAPGRNAIRKADWTVNQNFKAIVLGMKLKDEKSGTSSCKISGDFPNSAKITGSNGYFEIGVTAAIKEYLGEYRFTVTCTNMDGETESKTATLMVENNYEILNFYSDAPSAQTQIGHDMTFRWEMAPTDLRCFISAYEDFWADNPDIGFEYWLWNRKHSAQVAGTKEHTMAAPNKPGNYEYRLECEDPTVPAHQSRFNPVFSKPIQITIVDDQPASNLPVFDAFWLSSTRINTARDTTLNWSVQNADSCAASGAWSGAQNVHGKTILSDLAKGSHNYTLTCENAAGVSARTVTLEVTDPPVAEIIRFAFNGARKNEQDEDTIQVGEPVSLRWAASSAASCEIVGTGFSGLQPITNAGIALADAVVNTVGDHSFTLTCQGVDGGGPDTSTVTLTVLPADAITQFYIDTTVSTLELNGKLTLRWETQPADLVCLIRTTNVDWPQQEPGLSTELLLPPNYGEYPYELRCGDKPITETLIVSLQDNAVIDRQLTGQYFGAHTQIMALGDQPPLSAIVPGAGFGFASMLRIDGSGRWYNVLGENVTEAYWLWDFDKGQIHLGGSNLRALDVFLPPYRLYSPDRMRRENTDGSPAQFYPDVDPPLSEQIGTFEYRGHGEYAVKFNLQIFFDMAGYPLAKLELLMRISENPDGSLRITTLDEHPDGKTWFDDVNEYLPLLERVPVADGIPGVLLPSLNDVYPAGHPRAGEPLENAGFPARISPWFFSDRMVKVESAIARNGIPETIMKVMRLDPDLVDQDGDGIFDNEEIGENWVLPKQSNLDGIYDLLKPREFIDKPHFVGQIALGNGERVVLYKDDLAGLSFFPIENYAPIAFWRELSPHWLEGGGEHPYYYTIGGDNPRLPTVNAQGETLHYDLGTLWVYSHNEYSAFAPFNIYFSNGVPPGLVLYDVRERWSTYLRDIGTRSASFAEVPWELVLDADGNHDGKSIRVLSIPSNRSAMGIYSARLALAHTQSNRQPVFDGKDQTYIKLLETAKNYTYIPLPPSTLEPSIASFAPSTATIALGKSTRLRWQVINNPDVCSLVYEGASTPVPFTGSYTVTPTKLGTHAYELICTKHIPAGVIGSGEWNYQASRSTSVQVVDPAELGNDSSAADLVGVYVGEHRITMRGCPGVCVAGEEIILGRGVKNAEWIWNFDEQTVLIRGTTLTVGFNYEVQAPGNVGADEDARLTAPFTNNGDGTYTVQHGFQIYNPGVGNPRADTFTTFRITRDTEHPDRINIVTLDGDGDGIPGTQIPGVFPMTIQPDFAGAALRDTTSTAGDGILDTVKLALRLNPDAINGDTDGDGIPDRAELGPDLTKPIDSDGDGIIDALEPGEAANDAKTVAGLALLDGIPGRTEEGWQYSGTTARVRVAGDWRFTGADTGVLQLTNANDDAGAIPDVTLGDMGLDYHHGFVQVRVCKTAPASGPLAPCDATPQVAPASEPITLTFTYDAALPPANTLLVYATQRVDGKERYTKLNEGWRRVDDHTLEITVRDNSVRDLDDGNGALRIGIAPTANTLGGHNQSSGNASGGGGGSMGVWMLLALLALAGLSQARQVRVRRGHITTKD